jgi:hypothetical protein
MGYCRLDKTRCILWVILFKQLGYSFSQDTENRNLSKHANECLSLKFDQVYSLSLVLRSIRLLMFIKELNLVLIQ